MSAIITASDRVLRFSHYALMSTEAFYPAKRWIEAGIEMTGIAHDAVELVDSAIEGREAIDSRYPFPARAVLFSAAAINIVTILTEFGIGPLVRWGDQISICAKSLLTGGHALFAYHHEDKWEHGAETFFYGMETLFLLDQISVHLHTGVAFATGALGIVHIFTTKHEHSHHTD